mmetsp:Transcript_19793/g.51130  ORF Transcript_19793/g.51130 Transcript_19793/m.51130 type:complete len:249 (-) Transcript_19793:800-1546(-)
MPALSIETGAVPVCPPALCQRGGTGECRGEPAADGMGEVPFSTTPHDHPAIASRTALRTVALKVSSAASWSACSRGRPCARSCAPLSPLGAKREAMSSRMRSLSSWTLACASRASKEVSALTTRALSVSSARWNASRSDGGMVSPNCRMAAAAEARGGGIDNACRRGTGALGGTRGACALTLALQSSVSSPSKLLSSRRGSPALCLPVSVVWHASLLPLLSAVVRVLCATCGPLPSRSRSARCPCIIS